MKQTKEDKITKIFGWIKSHFMNLVAVISLSFIILVFLYPAIIYEAFWNIECIGFLVFYFLFLLIDIILIINLITPIRTLFTIKKNEKVE